MEEDKDIKILEDVLKDKDTKLWIGEQGIQAIENLIARYKELEEINIHQSKSLLKYQNSIPKSKVKEKIEELKFIQKRADDIKNGLKIETRTSANKEDRERSKKELEQFEIPELINEYQIEILQELLED